MSVILKALKQSASERGDVNDIPRWQSAPATPGPNRAIWPWIILSASLLLALLVFMIFQPFSSSETQQTVQTPLTTESEIETASPRQSPELANADISLTETNQSQAAKLPQAEPGNTETVVNPDRTEQAEAKPAKTSDIELNEPAFQDILSNTPTLTANTAEIKPSATTPAVIQSAQTTAYSAFYALPATVQQQLSSLKINVYRYHTDADKRWVLIDMKRHRIGDTVAEMFYLQDIGQDHLILKHESDLIKFPE